MQYLLHKPTRPPFSDWLAQCSRKIERQTGLQHHASWSAQETFWKACYDVGLSPNEAAADWLNG